MKIITKGIILVTALIVLLAYGTVMASEPDCTNTRHEFKFKSYPSDETRGWYTDKCCSIDIDHVVSLKEACVLGLPKSRWEEFANDHENHVPACSSVNRSKGSSGPEDFYRKATDGKGRDYIIVRFEEYLELYYYILNKYGLEKEPFDRSSLFMSSRR
jgi:hypothetical protein